MDPRFKKVLDNKDVAIYTVPNPDRPVKKNTK